MSANSRRKMKAVKFYTDEQFDRIAERTLCEADLYPMRNRPRVQIDLLLEGFAGVELDQFAEIPDLDVLGATRIKGNGFTVDINSALTKRYDAKYALDWEHSLWRTTLGHELGHVILHRHELAHASLLRCTNREIVRPTVRIYDQVEFQANALMAAILMPKRLVIDCYTDADIRLERPSEIIEDLAESFEVSKTAMTIRLKRIGLDPFDR